MGEAGRTGKKPSQRLPPVLGPDFFDRNADTVARDLLGKALVREHAGRANILHDHRDRGLSGGA